MPESARVCACRKAAGGGWQWGCRDGGGAEARTLGERGNFRCRSVPGFEGIASEHWGGRFA